MQNGNVLKLYYSTHALLQNLFNNVILFGLYLATVPIISEENSFQISNNFQIQCFYDVFAFLRVERLKVLVRYFLCSYFSTLYISKTGVKT